MAEDRPDTNLTDRDIVQTRPLVISPFFSLPLPDEMVSYDLEDEDDDVGDEIDGGEGDSTLAAPTGLAIKSQTYRIAKDGRTVIDVVLTFNTVPGVTNYDVRVSKE